MNDVYICDKRKATEFQGITFSNFKKSKVMNELLSSIIQSKIEQAYYWSSELICAGHFADVWDIIILYLSKYIHLGNPKLPIYIAKRIEQFKTIVISGYLENELEMRNNKNIRNIFAEIVAVLCLSKKKHHYESIKIKKMEEYNVSIMSLKLKAPSVEYAKNVFRDNDPQELFIAINEFAYHISLSSKNTTTACYWFEWILEYDNICKIKKEKCICVSRTFPDVQEKYKKDPIWIIWETILNECNERKCNITSKIINALLEVFYIKFSFGVKKRRRFIIYFAISLITEPVDFTIEIINSSQKIQIKQIVDKINLIYKDVKKNEIIPIQDGENNETQINKKEKTNLEKTIEKLELMNKIINKNDNKIINKIDNKIDNKIINK